MGRSRSRSRSRGRRESRRGGDRSRDREDRGSRRSSEQGGGRRDRPIPQSLLVRGISTRTTEEDLRKAFSRRNGDIRDVYIPKDHSTNEARGFAFIEFHDIREAREVKHEMDHADLDGRQIAVLFAQERRKTPDQMKRMEGGPQRGGRRSRSRGRDGRDGREGREGRDGRDSRNGRDSRDNRRRRSRTRSKSKSRSRSRSNSGDRKRKNSRSRSNSSPKRKNSKGRSRSGSQIGGKIASHFP